MIVDVVSMDGVQNIAFDAGVGDLRGFDVGVVVGLQLVVGVGVVVVGIVLLVYSMLG